jgi:hypothetical protein
MKSKYILLQLFIICIGSNSLTAQTITAPIKKNSITINTARHWLYDTYIYGYYASIFNITTFAYERKLNKNWMATLAIGKSSLIDKPVTENLIDYDFTLNKDSLINRGLYTFIDLSLGYQILNWKGFSLTTSVGPSFTWGKNRYVTAISINPEPPMDALIFTEYRKKQYLGALANVNINYNFWKNRLRAGLFVTARYYPGIAIKQLDTGFQLGFNF